MRYGSVCSGIEAASCAWEPLGWTPVFFAEIEKFPSSLLAQQFPTVPNLGDITKYKEWPDANIDVLVGGTPCQAFSVAGLRGGLTDPRGNLTLTFLAILDRFRPRWFLWENVPGVLSSRTDGRSDFGTFLDGVSELGYGYAWRVLDLQFAGVPQRRRRVFVVGHSGDWRRAAAVLLERESMSGNPAPSRKAGQGITFDVAPSIGASGRGFARTGESRGPDCLIPEWPAEVAPTLNAHFGDKFGYEDQHAMNGAGLFVLAADLRNVTSPWNRSNPQPGDPCHTLHKPGDTVIAFKASHFTRGKDGAPADVVPPLSADADKGDQDTLVLAFSSKDHGADAGEIAPTLRSMGHDGSHANGGGQVAIAFNARQDPINGPINGPIDTDPMTSAVAFESRYVRNGRGAPSDLVPPLKAQSGQSGKGDAAPLVATAMHVRRITPTEAERLMGFPDGWTNVHHRGKPAADGPRYKALGNSMGVPEIAWIGRRIELVDKLPGGEE